MEECVFCKIRKGEIPSTKLYEDDEFMIIKDINPQAKVHLIAIPTSHVPYIDMMTEEGTQPDHHFRMRSLAGSAHTHISHAYRRYISLSDLPQSVVIHEMSASECKPIWEKQYLIDHGIIK